MDAAHLQRRILVVVVTTRAAASSLRGDGEGRAAVLRGIQILDGMTDEVARDGDATARDQLAQARAELAAMLEDGATDSR
jgi:hypothetical protein